MTVVAAMPAPVGAAASADRPALRVEDPLARPDWDQLVATHPHATFFHGSAWARTLVESYGFECRYITAIQDGRLVGLLPIIEANSWLRGKRGVSLPFTDECPPLVSECITAEALFNFALAEGQRRGWRYLEMRGGQDSQIFPESLSHYGHILCLPSSFQELFNGFHSSVRRAIRKAEKSGVTVDSRSDSDALRGYYRLHCRTRTRHGAPPQPLRFFELLQEHVLKRGFGFVSLAFYRGRAIAGALFVQSGSRAIYKFSASDERFQELRGANLVLCNGLARLVSQNVAELNFGRTSLSNDGLRRFKQAWGAQEYMIRTARYCFERRSFVRVADLAAGAQSRMFSALPVFLSRWVGSVAYPHLS
jgi:hypothetical protein